MKKTVLWSLMGLNSDQSAWPWKQTKGLKFWINDFERKHFIVSRLLKLCTHDQDLHICKFCIREQKYFLLCVHMAFKDQQNLSKVEILFYNSNSYFLELRTCLNISIWILQVS